MIQLPSNLENPWFLLLFAVLLIIQLVLLFRYLYWCMESKSWEKIPAKIVKCEFKKGSVKDETVDSISVLYVYKVNGKEFTNNKIALSDYACSWLVSPAKKLIKKIYLQSKTDSSIFIFHEKDNPRKSCIDINFDLRIVFFSFLSMVFIVFLLLESSGVYKLTF